MLVTFCVYLVFHDFRHCSMTFIVLLLRNKKVVQIYFCQDLYTVFQVLKISHKMVVVGYCIFQTHFSLLCVCVCVCVHAHVCGACFF